MTVKYQQSDDGNVIDGKIVVWIVPSPSAAPPPSSGHSWSVSSDDQDGSAPSAGSTADDGTVGGGEPVGGRADGAAAGAKTEEAGAAAAAAPEENSPQLVDPEWFHDDENDNLHHDDDMGMRVKAPGCDGRKVRFFVEHKHGGAWAPFLVAEAEVVSGVAQTEMHAQHPAAHLDHEDLAPAELRFRAWLV